jgi:acyl-CoA synthetase (AMP-forming)/AMP-acid ligase II
VTGANVESARTRASQLVLPELLRRNAARFPAAPALAFQGRTTTYAELAARSDRVAAALHDRGVNAGDRVGLWLYNGIEIVECLFGIHKLGAFAVPINFRLSPDEAAFIVEDAAVSGLIAEHNLRIGAGGALAPGWDLSVGPGSESSYEAALEAATETPSQAELDDDAPAFLMYTSGTTGRPKGALLSHKNLVVNTANWIFEVGATRGDVYLFGFPLFHIGGLVGLYPFIEMGGLSVILPSGGFDPGAVLDSIEASDATVAAFVPAQWQALLDHPDAEAKLRRVRRAIWGGSPASRPLLERMVNSLPPESVMSAFGQTEVTANAVWLAPQDSLRKLGAVGLPALTMEHRIVDETDEPVRRGEVGEIVYRGPTVMLEYFGRPDANADTFRGGWFHSGDLVREDEDGYIWVVDRKNDMIVSGGENIYPAEVERVLVEHPAVVEAAVFGVADERWGETTVACIVTEAAVTVTIDELRAFCTRRLARYKQPARLAIVDALPRNPSGKVLKRVLREEFESLERGIDATAG